MKKLLLILTVVALAAFTLAAADPPQSSKAAPRRPAPLPDNVEKRTIVLWSDGTRMAGDLYLPKERKEGEKFPAIVLCAGTGGTKAGTQARLGAIFASKGYVALAFDYRGWGTSESQLMAVEPQPRPDKSNEMTIKVKALRWQMNYTDQTEDIRAAISFVAGEPSVDKDRIGIWGSSYGGGLVTWMAANDPRVKCVAAQVPGMGSRGPQATARIYDQLSRQARGEIEPVPIETGKFTGKMATYDQMRVNPPKSIGFDAVEAGTHIKVPALFVLAENEELSNNGNVQKVFEAIRAAGIPAQWHVIKGITHYGVYGEGFDEATKVELEWFDRHLKATGDPNK